MSIYFILFTTSSLIALWGCTENSWLFEGIIDFEQKSNSRFRPIGVEIKEFNDVMIVWRFLKEKLGFRSCRGLSKKWTTRQIMELVEIGNKILKLGISIGK